MKLGYVARWMVAGGVAVAVACGGSTSGTSSTSLESKDGGDSDAVGDGGGDDALSDGGGGGDLPISSCGCEYRPSECIDDDTARWFSMGCDAGACEYTAHTEKCPPVADGPACKEGACPMVYVR